MKPYHLTILGEPKSQLRARATRRGKHAGIHENPKSAQAKANIRVIVQEQAPEEFLTGPLCVNIEFCFGRPKSHYGTGKNAGKLKWNAPYWHTKKPDRDNLDKLVLDALTGVFWKDDAIVCEGRITKHYDERPRTEIWLQELEA